MRLIAPNATFVAIWAIGIVLAASVADAAQLTLSWVHQSNGTAAFRIERKVGTAGMYGEIAQQQAGQSSYVDTTVAAGTTYCYRVRAFDAGGTSGYSNEACGSVTAGLTVSVTKSGSGIVTSSPSGINCGAACSATYPAGTVVTLTATPASGWTFTGWTRGCTGTTPCVLATNGSVAVNANFAAVQTPAPSPAPTSYVIGARVQVVGTNALNVRSGPGTSFSKVGPPQRLNKLGTIVGGPSPGVPGGDPWVKVNYDTGTDGWSSTLYLHAVSPGSGTE